MGDERNDLPEGTDTIIDTEDTAALPSGEGTSDDTGATVIARGMGSQAAATFLGHASTAITEGHYLERDESVDPTPAEHLERTLRPVNPEGDLLARPPTVGEQPLLAAIDRESEEG